MSKAQIDQIANFIVDHPETVASRRICREVLGEGLEHCNQEFAAELVNHLYQQTDNQIESYYYLIR